MPTGRLIHRFATQLPDGLVVGEDLANLVDAVGDEGLAPVEDGPRPPVGDDLLPAHERVGIGLVRVDPLGGHGDQIDRRAGGDDGTDLALHHLVKRGEDPVGVPGGGDRHEFPVAGHVSGGS